jgi:hypothetical protein
MGNGYGKVLISTLRNTQVMAIDKSRTRTNLDHHILGVIANHTQPCRGGGEDAISYE